MTKQHTNMLNRLMTMFALLAVDAILYVIGIAGAIALARANLPVFACLYVLAYMVALLVFTFYYIDTATDHDWKFAETYLDFRMSVFSANHWLERD